MGLFFMLAADCGSKGEAETFARFFSGKKVAGSSLDAHVFKERGSFWVSVVPKGVGQSGLVPELVGRFNALAEGLYELLKGAPRFRFALVEVEAEMYSAYASHLLDGHLPKGSVVSEEVLKAAGSEAKLAQFAKGYVWVPFVPYE